MGTEPSANLPRRSSASGEALHGLPAHGVFESVAERFADRTAVVCGQSRVTYTQLNAWANTIANRFLDHDLRSEDRVAMAVPKSIAHVASVLGILKAGGVYVPVVANQPPERLRVILDDAECRFAVTDPAYLPGLLNSVPIRIDPEQARSGNDKNPGLPIGPDHLAYIMYTSGSTGQPKGAMIEHAGIVRLVHGQDYMPFGPDLNFLYGGPLSFDLSTIEIYTPLLHGSKLLVSTADVLTPDVVRHYAENEGLNAVCVSFSLFRALFEAEPEAFERIPVIGVCGEPADPRFIRRAQELLPNAQFYNAYGPTECTALTTTHQIPRPCPLDPPIVPIGVALNGMKLHIRDESGNSVPHGGTGELVIGGVGLARGYLKDPALTDARFVHDPHTGERLYRSGDLVRSLPDGAIAYLGRIDDQVKIRGQRIELGEIDSVLMQDPDLAAAASVVIGSGADARVAACVLPVNPEKFDRSGLMSRLTRRLTAAMVPSTIVPVREIPINRNGKVDRSALKELVLAEAQRADRIQHSSESNTGTEAEQALSSICESILAGTKIDPRRTFAQNGGNSLKAMLFRVRIRECYGAEVSVPEIIAAENFKELAYLVEGRSGLSMVPDSPESIAPGPVPMSPAQRRLWIVQQADPGDASYNVAYRFRLSSSLDREALRQAWHDLHERHPALRTGFPDASSADPTATLHAKIDTGIQWSDTSLGDPGMIRSIITKPFDITNPPLTRLIVSERDGCGLLVMHHIVTDAWSMELIFRDLEALYQSRLRGTDVSLPDPGPGASGQAAHLQATVDPENAARDAFEAASPFRERMPTVGRIADEQRSSPSGKTSAADVPDDLLRSIADSAQRCGVTRHAVWVSLFAAWAGPLCGTKEPAIGLPVSTRDDGPYVNAVGFFVETVPVLIDVSVGDPDQRTKRAAASISTALLKRSVPFDTLVRYASGGSRDHLTPITSVYFNAIDRAPIEWGPSKDRLFEPAFEEVDNGLARFDLLCTLYNNDKTSRIVVTARDAEWQATDRIPNAADFIAFMRLQLGLHARAMARTGSMPSLEDSDPASDKSVGPQPLDPETEHAMWSVVDVFREVLADPSFGPDDDFFARGGDSLRAVRAFSIVRRKHPTDLAAASMFRDATPRSLARRLSEHANTPVSEPFLRVNEKGRVNTGWILPGVTGDILSMRRLVAGLGDDWSCHAALYPGTTPDRKPFDSLPEMVRYFYDAIRKDYDPQASAFIGYSLGGILGYELAVRLQNDGLAPRLLVIVDAHLLKKYPVKFKPVPISVHAKNLFTMPRHERGPYIARRVEAVKRRLRKAAKTSEAYDELPEVRRLTFANLKVVHDYRPTAKYGGRVLIVQGYRPDWMYSIKDDGANGWSEWLVQKPITVSVQASHMNLIKSDAAYDVARAIRDAAADA